ncbi:MAG: hypothetical protein IJ717_07870 [Treponema sp.]|nr:hypothetical protein [Treponema sp.]MBR1714841.1 hypothetical protein [Treponema sp.]
MKYRRKETIEAVQWNGKNQAELKEFAKQFAMFDYADVTNDGQLDHILKVKTAERIIVADVGDYVVRGEKGDFFVMKKGEFESIYEEA